MYTVYIYIIIIITIIIIVIIINIYIYLFNSIYTHSTYIHSETIGLIETLTVGFHHEQT